MKEEGFFSYFFLFFLLDFASAFLLVDSLDALLYR